MECKINNKVTDTLGNKNRNIKIGGNRSRGKETTDYRTV